MINNKTPLKCSPPTGGHTKSLGSLGQLSPTLDASRQNSTQRPIPRCVQRVSFIFSFLSAPPRTYVSGKHVDVMRMEFVCCITFSHISILDFLSQSHSVAYVPMMLSRSVSRLPVLCLSKRNNLRVGCSCWIGATRGLLGFDIQSS